MTKTILSRQNPEIKHLVQLHKRKGRNEHKQFIAEGIRTITSLYHSSMKMIQLYITEKAAEQYKGELSQLPKHKMVMVGTQVMRKITTSKTPSGVLGLFTIPETPDPEQLTPGLVLVDMSDAGNMGTLIRTVAAMGCKTVVIINGVDPWSAKVVHATAGTIGMVNIYQLYWDELLQYKKNIPLYALVVSGGKNPQEISLKNSLLMIGSEAHGLSESFVEQADDKITLDMPGNTESLNAAVAGSIALYLAWT